MAFITQQVEMMITTGSLIATMLVTMTITMITMMMIKTMMKVVVMNRRSYMFYSTVYGYSASCQNTRHEHSCVAR